MAGLAVVTAAVCLLLRQYRPELALPVSLAAGALLLWMSVTALEPVLETVRSLMTKGGIRENYVKIMVKTLGICYLTRLAADSCTDAGQAALAGKVELAGRVCLLVLALPLFESLLETATRLLTLS